jgi:hypothetical protein
MANVIKLFAVVIILLYGNLLGFSQAKNMLARLGA